MRAANTDLHGPKGALGGILLPPASQQGRTHRLHPSAPLPQLLHPSAAPGSSSPGELHSPFVRTLCSKGEGAGVAQELPHLQVGPPQAPCSAWTRGARKGVGSSRGWDGRWGSTTQLKSWRRVPRTCPSPFPTNVFLPLVTTLWYGGSGPVAITVQVQAGSPAPAAPCCWDHPLGNRGGIKT